MCGLPFSGAQGGSAVMTPLADRPRSHADVSIPADGVQLGGELHSPAGTTGVVAFAHGSGSSRLSPRNRSGAAAQAHP